MLLPTLRDGSSSNYSMQQLQDWLRLLDERFPVKLHWQCLGSKVKFLVVTLLVLFRQVQFHETTFVSLLVWLSHVQF